MITRKRQAAIKKILFNNWANWTTVVEEEEAVPHRSEDFLQISTQTVPLRPLAPEVIRSNLAGS